MKIVISLGGSLIYPETIDIEFIKKFKHLIEDYIQKDFSFVLICGGGKLARNFQSAAESIVDLEDIEKDWLGIAATTMNANLIKSVFKDTAYEEIISDPTLPIKTDKKVIVCSGWKPGWSTDYDAVLIAKNLGANTIINMSNITHVYDSDPKKNPDAKKLDNISWKDFRKLVGDKWSPGLNMPFDPIASIEAEKNGNNVIIIGNDLDNLRKVLDEKDFIGTVIN